jgi:DNA-binding transcriptional ArsR family regulator
METRRDVFQAIADPTRRAIIALLATQSLNLNAVAANFEMSRPAISQHIKVLTECGLVAIRQEGRERYCEARLGQLNEVTDWATTTRHLWMQRLSALDTYLHELQAKSKDKKHKHKKHGKKKRNR